MKNAFKLFGIIALAAAIGFSMSGCVPEPGAEGDDIGTAFLGETLNLSGQVYVEKQNETHTGISLSYQTFNGNVEEFTDRYGGTGKITNGQLSYSIGTPSLSSLETIFENVFSQDYDDFTISRQNVKGAMIWSMSTGNDTYLSKENAASTSNWVGTSYSYFVESVGFVYVDNDVTLSGKGKREDFEGTEHGVKYTDTLTTSNFNFTLKTGWNAVYSKYSGSMTVTGSSQVSTRTETKTKKNPSLRWVLREIDDGGEVVQPLTSGQWANGNLDSYNSVDVYFFTVTSGTTYYIWWNGVSDGNDTKTADVVVSASYAGGNYIFTGEDSGGWTYPQSFTASSNGAVFIEVRPKYGAGGTYGIAFSSNNSRPNVLGNIMIAPSHKTTDPETVLKDGLETSKNGKFGFKKHEQLRRLQQK
jgi:hypothetical protein